MMIIVIIININKMELCFSPPWKLLAWQLHMWCHQQGRLFPTGCSAKPWDADSLLQVSRWGVPLLRTCYQSPKGWRECSSAKSTCCSITVGEVWILGPTLGSSQIPATLAPRGLMPSFSLWGYTHMCTHTYIYIHHTYKLSKKGRFWMRLIFV